MSTAIARIFNSYGPRMRPGDGRAVPTFIRQALAGEPVTITGNGQQTRSLCYVDDTIDGILALVARDWEGIFPGDRLRIRAFAGHLEAIWQAAAD